MSRLTIVTVCYQNLSGLRATIDSLLSQEDQDFEHWVVDGGSRDGTQNFLQGLKVPWRLHSLSEKDQGIYDAMNKGIALASGDYVWFLNAGDLCHSSTTIKDLNRAIDENPLADLIYGKVRLVTSLGARLVGSEVSINDFRIGMPICHQAVLYRRTLIQKSGYSTQYRIISDWILTRSLFLHGRAQFIDLVFADFDDQGVSSHLHWKTLKEKVRYEPSTFGKIHILLFSGGKYLLIYLTKKTGLYSFLKRRQLGRESRS